MIIIKKVFSGDLFKKSTILIISSVVSNIVALLGYFLLVKAYQIDIVGEYFALFAMASILGAILHFGFAQAIPLMNDSELKHAVTLLISISLLTVSIGITLLVFGFKVYLIPLFAGILSVSSLSEVIFVRSGSVLHVAIFRMLTPFLSFSTCIVAGFIFEKDYNLLALSYLFGLSLVVCSAARIAVLPNLSLITMVDVSGIIKKYANFMKFIGPGMVFNVAAYNIPSAVGISYFGGASIAAYNLAYKFVLAPMSIIGKAVGQSYVSSLSSKYRKESGLGVGFKLDIALFLLSLVSCVAVYLFFPLVAKILFPDNHQEISSFAVALLPLAFSMLFVAPLSSLFQFTNNQKKVFSAHLLTLLCSGGSFAMAVYCEDFLLGVTLFSALVLVRYSWLYAEILKVRKSNVQKALSFEDLETFVD